MKFSWDMPVPRLVLTGDDPEFDPVTISNFKDEGFDVSYLQFDGNKKEYVRELDHLADPLELGEKWALICVLLTHERSCTFADFVVIIEQLTEKLQP